MERDPRIASLERYRATLEVLLSLVDGGGDPSDPSTTQAWRRCGETLEVFEKQHAERAGEPCPEEVQEAIKESMRLNAVAVSELVRSKSELVGKQRELKRTQAMLDARRSFESSGRSCDMSG